MDITYKTGIGAKVKIESVAPKYAVEIDGELFFFATGLGHPAEPLTGPQLIGEYSLSENVPLLNVRNNSLKLVPWGTLVYPVEVEIIIHGHAEEHTH